MLDRPPYHEDFFQHIINVNWTAGAVFITGNSPGACYFKVASAGIKPDFSNLSQPDFGDNGIVFASSYANVSADPLLARKDNKPTFLLGGIRANIGEASNEHAGVIYASSDGLNWSEVFNEINNSVNMLVWDKTAQSFFADITDFTIADNSGCWASTTGDSWELDGGDFFSHCEFGLPDGQFGYDEKHKLFISASSIGAVALTFAGGIWAKTIVETIAGELAPNRTLWVSFDGTKTWVSAGNIPEADAGIITICGGPLADLQSRS